MSKIKAIWTIELNVTCPCCKNKVDLMNDCDFWEDRKEDFSILHQTDQEVYCPECGSKFICDFDH